jgi:hypothetical protein
MNGTNTGMYYLKKVNLEHFPNNTWNPVFFLQNCK